MMPLHQQTESYAMTTNEPLKYASEEERAITRKLVGDLLAAGCDLSVYDGEEWVLRRSADEQAVLEALNSTDHDGIAVYLDDERLGDIVLIWGNGADLISNYSDSEELEELIKPALELYE